MGEANIEWWVAVSTDRGTLFRAIREEFGGHTHPDYPAWWERAVAGFHRDFDDGDDGDDSGGVTFPAATLADLRRAVAIADRCRGGLTIGCTVATPTVRATAQVGEEYGEDRVTGAVVPVGPRDAAVAGELDAIRTAVGRLDLLTRGK